MLQYIELFGININLLELFNTIGSLSIAFWILFHLKEYKEVSVYSQLAQAKVAKKHDNFFTRWIFVFVEVLVFYSVISVLEIYIAPIVSKITIDETGPNFFYNIFAYPFLVAIFAIIIRVTPLKILDLLAPAICIALIFFKIACFCWGCCFGVETEKFGMYNANTERVDFPVQLVETGCAVIMLIILLVLRRKKNLKQGLLYPLFILMYCGSRFISEFWRDDYTPIVGKMTTYHFQCIVGFVEGLVLLAVVLIFGKKITEYYASKRQAILERDSLFSNEDDSEDDSEV